MADVKGAAQLLERFKKLIEAGEYETAKTVATQLKLAFTSFTALPPVLTQTPTKQQELAIARDMLEHSILLAVHLKDDVLFDRNFVQLKAYYTDLRGELPRSEQEAPVLGLNLLRLLTQNRVAEFHVELELLDAEAQANVHISFPRQLEQQLMEGTYGKVLASMAAAPSPHCAWFLSQLKGTVRDELASCASAAYRKLSLKDAAAMLNFQTQHELKQYCNDAGWRHDAGHVYFEDPEPKATDTAASLDVFHNMLTYARELDRII